MPDIKYQRPEPNYITKTSTTHANRFQGEAQDQNPLKASDLDREFNALIDNDNDISERMAQIAAGLFPGSNAPENRNKIVYSDGTEAKWKMLSAENISDNAITSEKISNNAVIRGKVAIGAIGTNNLIDRNVTNAKLGNTSVDTRVLADSSVTTPKIQDGSVTASKLSVNSVTTEKILDNSVTTSKFADGSFTTNKLADDSLTPRKTHGCFILGELKFSVLDAGDLSIFPFIEGWIPISNRNSQCLIPADCFPELRDQLKKYSDNTNRLSGTTRYISLKRYQGESEHNGLVYFDFDTLFGAYPMLIGSTFPVNAEQWLHSMAVVGADQLISGVFPNVKEEFSSGNFTTWNIPRNALREYINGTIATANANYDDFAGLQQHQTSRRFGEETINLKVENMPKHSHGFSYTTPRTDGYYDWGGKGEAGKTYHEPATINSITAETGESKPLPHLPPSIALYGYIYGGKYDPEGWPLALRT